MTFIIRYRHKTKAPIDHEMKVPRVIQKDTNEVTKEAYDLTKDPVLLNVLASWFDCRKNGRLWGVGRDKMAAGCFNKYVDIRERINGRPTIKGISLDLNEWRKFMAQLNEINKFMGIKVICTKIKAFKQNQT